MVDSVGPADNSAVVQAVRTELLVFDDSDIDTWFAMCENLMIDGGISQPTTMFRKILAKLPVTTFKLVKDLAIQSPLPPNCYSQLKDRLMGRLQLTSAERFQRLERLPRQLGSRKPSDFFADLASLYPNDVDHEIIREVFLSRMPPSIQILCREWLLTGKLRDVSLRADAHFQLFAPDNVATVVKHEVDYHSDNENSDGHVNSTHRFPDRRPNSDFRPQRAPAQPRSQQAATEATSFVDRWCRLHKKYGPRARKCLGSCTFSADMSGNARGSRQ